MLLFIYISHYLSVRSIYAKLFSTPSPLQDKAWMSHVDDPLISSSSVTRGLSSGGNEADDEYDYDDESVFAPVVIGVTSVIRRQSNSFELGNTGTQRQRHLRYLRNVHSAQARLTLSSPVSSREGDHCLEAAAAARKKPPTKVRQIARRSTRPLES